MQGRLGEAGEGDQVGRVDLDAGLLAQLGDRGVGEARALLGAAGGQAPESVVDAAGEEDLAVLALEEDHRARVKDGLRADLLPQAPEV